MEATAIGVKGLAASILWKAVNDSMSIRHGAPETRTVNRKELNEFFGSEWFETLCTVCGINERAIRDKCVFKEEEELNEENKAVIQA